MSIAPGANVTIEITATPRREAARKTLNRVCGKDTQIALAIRRRKAKRPSWQEKRRGGRWWHHQMKSKSPAQLTPGQKFEVRATLDVIRDLESVSDCVKVSAG